MSQFQKLSMYIFEIRLRKKFVVCLRHQMMRVGFALQGNE
jgi:hypothetical protein